MGEGAWPHAYPQPHAGAQLARGLTAAFGGMKPLPRHWLSLAGLRDPPTSGSSAGDPVTRTLLILMHGQCLLFCGGCFCSCSFLPQPPGTGDRQLRRKRVTPSCHAGGQQSPGATLAGGSWQASSVPRPSRAQHPLSRGLASPCLPELPSSQDRALKAGTLTSCSCQGTVGRGTSQPATS